MAHVDILNDVFDDFGKSNGSQLHFQRVTYQYGSGNSDDGYRFIWSTDGKYMAHRGQARIPSFTVLLKLLWLAYKGGWLR